MSRTALTLIINHEITSLHVYLGAMKRAAMESARVGLSFCEPKTSRLNAPQCNKALLGVSVSFYPEGQKSVCHIWEKEIKTDGNGDRPFLYFISL